jgi:hypothetical protein
MLQKNGHNFTKLDILSTVNPFMLFFFFGKLDYSWHSSIRIYRVPSEER